MFIIKSFLDLSYGLIILVSSFLAGGYFLIGYDKGDDITKQIQKINQDKDNTQAKITGLNEELKALQATDTMINQTSMEINKFLQFIPNKLTSAMVLNHLNNTAKAAGVNVENIKSYDAPVEKKEFYEKVKVNLTIEGVFSQVLVFLSNLTNLTEVITVESFSMRKSNKNLRKIKGLSGVTVTMDIYGYRYTVPIVDIENEKRGKK